MKHVARARAMGHVWRPECCCGWASTAYQPAVKVAISIAEAHVRDKGACGKHRFPTEGEALRAVVDAKIARSLRQRVRRREERAYRCDPCGAWHLTSKPERVTV